MRSRTNAFRPSAALLLLIPAPLLAADATFTVSGAAAHAISPYIYGVNAGTSLQGATQPTNIRLGGNRWTAYNWETNASNAGSDYNYQNDGYLSSSSVPGAAVTPYINSTAAGNQALVVTIPTAGYVSADKAGPVPYSQWAPANGTATNPAYTGSRFYLSSPTSGSSTITPNLSDNHVYQNEFVNFIKSSATAANHTGPIFYSLDNEPDLWSSTHAELRVNTATSTGYQNATYSELRDRSVAYATAIKAADPTGKVIGAVNYGFYGFYALQGQSDPAAQQWNATHTGNDAWFSAYYLDAMKKASDAAGKRLLDVLDIHYYSEALGTDASGNSVRVTTNNNDPGVVAARLQAPRSLWDPTYKENSYITSDILSYTSDKTLHLTSRLQSQINTYNPGTGLSISEYNFGGTNHISGAIAEADALGIFGREGYTSANFWDLTSSGSNSAYARAAFDMYLNYDGHGSRFGDLSLSGLTTNNDTTSLYAALDSTNPNRLTLVALNKTADPLSITLSLSDFSTNFTTLLGYDLTAASTTSTLFDSRTISGNSITLTLSPYSVNTFALTGTPLPEPTLAATLLPTTLLLRRNRRDN